MVKNELKFELASAENINAYARRMNEEFAEENVGYYHLPRFGDEAAAGLAKLPVKEAENIVLVGVGGSSLGVKALYEMLGENHASSNLKSNLIFLDNLDPYMIQTRLAGLDFERSLFVISSKSGTTIETISIFKCLIERFNSNLKNGGWERFIVVTDPASKLENFARGAGASVFNIPKNVGGRFSVLSAIGLVPLGLAGADIAALLEGASACKKQFIDGDDDTILQKAYHYATHPNARVNVLFSYSTRFASFNDWYVQLWAESLGKKRGYKRVGLTPVGLVGSKDQHSFLQLIMEGVKDKTVTFVTLKEHGAGLAVPQMSLAGLETTDFTNSLKMGDVLNAQARATMQALLSENISVDLLELDKMDAWHAGWLIYYFELLTSATGLMLGINTYDQPGVELGKRLLRNMLEK